jgi:spermidine/putrescine transport system ATP-binding protein
MGEVNLFDVEGTATGELHGRGVEIHINGTGAGLDLTLPQGECGTLMVRPESVRFLNPGETTDFVVRGILRAEYSLGSRMQYKVEAADGSELAVEKLREDRFTGQIGSEVVLGWDIENAHMINES